MRKKYKRMLTAIVSLIIVCCGIGVIYLFYDKTKNKDTIVEADGELSINYINGKEINSNGIYEFSVTNNSNKDIYYEVNINEIKGYDGNLKYSITSTEASINVSNMQMENNELLLDNILIKSKLTQNFKLTIENNNRTSFKLGIKKINDTEEYFFTSILNDNEVKKEPNTKPALDASLTSEGLIEDVDDYGLTYYFRGNIQNNYVNFANNLWRIVRINGDGTIRLVLNSSLGELSSYHSSIETSEDYKNADINKKLLAFYENELKTYDNYIANTRYCNEIGSTTNENDKTYNVYTRIITNSIPTFNCLGEKYTSKVGLLTADEVVYAGANAKDENKSYYLYNDKIESVWWTSSLAKTKSDTFYPFVVTTDGKLSDTTSGALYRGLRPVINIIKKVTVTGNGTLDNPYIINE